MADNVPSTILITGAAGQVGWELAHTLLPVGVVHALDRQSLDLADLDAVRSVVRSLRPTLIINAAAYTQVDKAESEQALAHRINAEAPGVFAEEAEKLGATIIHYSTDYVFGGEGTQPYRETDSTAPHSVYGKSKLAGDSLVTANASRSYIFRLAWVYDNRGRNFLRTIQRLASERDELRIVADQVGTPTWARSIALATTEAVQKILIAVRNDEAPPPSGVFHMASPDHTSWFGFAEKIVEALPAGVRQPRVVPISTAEYPTPAARPAWSVMDSSKLQREFGVTLPPWHAQLNACLATS